MVEMTDSMWRFFNFLYPLNVWCEEAGPTSMTCDITNILEVDM